MVVALAPRLIPLPRQLDAVHACVRADRLVGQRHGFRAAAAAALPSAVSIGEVHAGRVAMRGQSDAFSADDTERAFPFVATQIRELLSDAQACMAVVPGNGPVACRPASITFLKPQRRERQVMQPVQLTDALGKMWLAVSGRELLSDHTPRAGDCTIAKNDSRSR